MKKHLFCLLACCLPLHADDDTFRERFADPATRMASLAELIPGTRSCYFHTALAQQLAGRDAEFKQTMADWKSASQRKDSRVSADGMTVLENRQLLLDYQKSPQASLDELIRRLNLKFDDVRPDAAAAENLPTRLDPALISEAAFEQAAAAQDAEHPYSQYQNNRLFRELDHVANFDHQQIRWFIEHLTRADLPGVVPLVGRALDLDRTLSFTDHQLLTKLTADQLEALLKLHPDLCGKESFAIAFLTKHRPGTETDFERDPQGHAFYLKLCRDFALTLPPALNSLKAHILFHHLRLQETLGNYPKDDFLTFLALPRDKHPLLIVPENRPTSCIKLDADYQSVTGCPAVLDDESLIRSQLQHFLSLTDSAKDFAPFIETTALARLHARARLTAGVPSGKPATLLDPAEFKSLLDETTIDFAPGAPVLLASNAAAALTLDLKNTPDLLIRIYEIDLPAHFAHSTDEPDVNIDLEGLVPHHQRHLAFNQPPIVRHRETIQLPELLGPGAWLVDFVSGQVSARALIRKGSLTAYQEDTATGQSVRVFDETCQPVTTATIRLGRETFNADPTGRIAISDAPNQPLHRGILQAGKLAAPINLPPRTDNLALDARFHLDREQLLADQQAQLHLRVRLTNHGFEVPLDRIKEPALVLKAELLGGVTTERVIAENLTLKPLLEIPFQVPADLLKLTLTLRGTVTPTTGGDPVKLTQSAVYQINGDLKQSRVATAFFCPTADGHRLEVRGRNGEPLPSCALNLTAKRRDYARGVDLHVRTDAQGRVDLGKLAGIDAITATGTDIAESTYQPQAHLHHGPVELHLPQNSVIRLPLAKPAAKPERLELSLLEMVSGNPQRDHFDKLAVDAGQLVIRGLPSGDYQLSQGDDITQIKISGGIERDGLFISDTRILPRLAPPDPVIASATTANNELTIQLRNHSPDTRVSLIGKRYQYADGKVLYPLYPFQPPVADGIATGFTGCAYLTGERLSDETRYILERRSAKTFPGSMLPRPGLLLNRWTEADLNQEHQVGEGGGTGTGSGSGHGMGKLFGLPPDAEKKGIPATATVCDFLQHPAVIRIDLTPAADGSIKIPLADFAACQFIQILATDLFSNDSLVLPLPPTDTPVRDRRIARPLDPKTDYLATRSAAVLNKNAVATIENVLDADWRAFTTLTEAHQFLYGANPNERLREFTFLTEWPNLSDDKKLDLLAKHPCHELHLFLFRKDKPFFDKHVKPLLEGKPEPTFIDNFLLGRDLKPYLRAYAWQRLNAAEKALLAQALPDARQRITTELSQRWELEAPTPDIETALFTQTLRGSDLATTDSLGLARNELLDEPDAALVAYVNAKMHGIIIPKIDFENVTIEEALDFLRMSEMQFDPEKDPAKRGIGMFVSRPSGEVQDYTGHDVAEPDAMVIKQLRLTNVPFDEALKQVCDMTGLKYTITDHGIAIVPKGAGGNMSEENAIPSVASAASAAPDAVGCAFITEKLRRIVIPKIDFDDVTVREAIDFLRLRCAELDTLELDPAKKGFNFVIRHPRTTGDTASDPGDLHIKELRLKNVPLAVALKYICDSSHLRYKVDDYAVTLVPQTECGEDIFTRTFKVPRDFAASLDIDESAGAENDPFATPGKKQPHLTYRTPIQELLKKTGINFPEGTSAALSANGVLLVTNTPSEFDKIEQLVDAVGGANSKGKLPALGGAGDMGVLPPLDTPTGDAFATPVADPFAPASFEARNTGVLLESRPSFVPRFPTATRLWREANYYHNIKTTDEKLIPLNRFWLDLALWDGKGPFLSPHFNACTNTANEALMCLALLDLPFKAARPDVSVDGSTLRVKAREPMVLFYKDTRRTDQAAKESPLLVRQSFSPLDEPFLTVNGRQVENPVTGDFRPGIPYAASLVVTNPTGLGRRIDVLAQIPAGAIPLHGKPATLSSTHELKPYGVLMLDLEFYFPAAGEFPVYPLHVSEDGIILARSTPRVLRVTNNPAPQDAASWLALAANGSNDDVLARLRTANLNTIALTAIRWRLADRAFFLSATSILRDRLCFSPDVTSYGFRHNDPASIREYLENTGAPCNLGQWLDSQLLEIRPRVHHDWQTLEFDPLVNARAHRFGNESRITHQAAREHYQQLLDQLGWKPALDASDQLALTAFLFLQDRIGEALDRFQQIDPDKLPGRLNYDYLHAVALFYQEQAAAAKTIATNCLPSLPPGLWRDRFQTVIDQADEIAALDHPDKNAPPAGEPAAPHLDLTTGDGGKIVIHHRGLERATLRLFSVDLEVLFSKDPFLHGEGTTGGNPIILPNATLDVPLAKNAAETAVDLPPALRQGNVLVAAESGTVKLLRVLDSRALDLRQFPQDRVIQVLDATTLKPLPNTYIKVYAEMNDGTIVFHKDGYTDLRGKFDYLSHTGIDTSNIKRLALLASHPQKGARTAIYDR